MPISILNCCITFNIEYGISPRLKGYC